MMKDQKLNDRSLTVMWSAVATLVLLALLCLLPPFEVNSVHFKRANVLSSFVSIKDSESHFVSDANEDCPIPAEEAVKFSESGLEEFFSGLQAKTSERKVRIAFLGDSFIEGDILTAGFRDSLQSAFGGSGVGFVPFADPIARYRGTIRQEHSGWTCYNILRRKSVPERYRDEFFISGYVSVPSPGAVATFKSGSYKSKAITSTGARIFFKNLGTARMLVSVNGKAAQEHHLGTSGSVQCLEVTDPEIKTLSISLPDCSDFIGYGVSFESGNGVYVDNFGLRSSNGSNLLATSHSVNSQIGTMQKYDLVVLEYGLNVLQKTVTRYSSYQRRMEDIIRHIKAEYPESEILVMGIGDVGMRNDNGVIVTAPGAPAMVKYQRAAACNCGVCFWDTYTRMGGSGSMKRFVANRWAGKDYTHINSRGGDVIASLMLESYHQTP